MGGNSTTSHPIVGAVVVVEITSTQLVTIQTIGSRQEQASTSRCRQWPGRRVCRWGRCAFSIVLIVNTDTILFTQIYGRPAEPPKTFLGCSQAISATSSAVEARHLPYGISVAIEFCRSFDHFSRRACSLSLSPPLLEDPRQRTFANSFNEQYDDVGHRCCENGHSWCPARYRCTPNPTCGIARNTSLLTVLCIFLSLRDL